jgi:hypothetical protein
MADLQNEVSWFWLRFAPEELVTIVEAARREGLVAPLGHAADAADRPITRVEWTLTDAGRNLERTRALSLRDSVIAVRGVGAPVVSGVEKWGKRFGAGIALLLPAAAVGTGTVQVWVGIAAVGVVLGLVLAAGVRGEIALQRAARHWPRLETCRPAIYEWQSTDWRPWKRVPVVAAGTAYATLAMVALHVFGGWQFDVYIALGIAGFLATAALWFFGDEWIRWWCLSKAYRKERDEMERLRKKPSTDPCAWGYSCPRALDPASGKCPRPAAARPPL